MTKIGGGFRAFWVDAVTWAVLVVTVCLWELFWPLVGEGADVVWEAVDTVVVTGVGVDELEDVDRIDGISESAVVDESEDEVEISENECVDE